MSADQRWAYTLYGRASGGPFVHALDTVRRRAVCVDLPASLSADIGGARMTIGRGGGSLRIAADGVTRAVVDTHTFAVSARVARPATTVVRPAPRERVVRRGSGSVPWTLVAVAVVTLGSLAVAFILLPHPLRVGRRARPRDDLPQHGQDVLDLVDVGDPATDHADEVTRCS
jgi:hypothetical protein